MAGIRARKSRQSKFKKNRGAFKKKIPKSKKYNFKKHNGVLVTKQVQLSHQSHTLNNDSTKNTEVKKDSQNKSLTNKSKRNRVPQGDLEIIKQLIDKHGRNFKAMYMDKFNYKQFSVSKLKKLSSQFLTLKSTQLNQCMEVDE